MKEEKKEFVWTLNHDCNYHCPYCSLFYRNKEKNTTPFERKTLKFSPLEWRKHWHKIYEKYGSVQIHIVGGEPTIYPSFFDLIKEISKEHYLGFDTNLSVDMEPLIEKVSPSRLTFGIGASFHPCNSIFYNFIAKVKKLAQAGFKIWINYVAYPPQLNQAIYYKKEVEKEGFNFVMQPFSGKYKEKNYPESYTEKERRVINSIAEGDEELEKNMEYQLDRKTVTGKSCHAGEKFAYILEDGTVKRCGETQSSILGNIVNADFDLWSGPKPCNCETCYCEFKWLAEEEEKISQKIKTRGNKKKSYIKTNELFTREPESPQLQLGDEWLSLQGSASRNPEKKGAADFSPQGSTDDKIDVTEVYNNTELYLEKMEELEEKEKKFRKKLEIEKRNPESLKKLSEVFKKKYIISKTEWIKQYYLKMAEQRICDALEKESRNPWILAEAAEIYLYKGNRQRAREYVERAMSIVPDEVRLKKLKTKIEKNKKVFSDNINVENKQIKLEEKANSKKATPEKIFWNWDIHYSCNYDCSYCFFHGRWKGVSRKNRYPGVEKWIKRWYYIYDKYGECHIQISGGEPSSYPNFLKLVHKLSQKHTVELTTNLSFNVRKLSHLIPPARVKLSSAFHREFTQLDSFLNKAVYLKEKGYIISVTCVGYPPYLKRLIEVKNKIEDKGLTFVLQPFRGKYQDKEYPEGYTEEEKKILKELTGSFVDNKDIFSHHVEDENIKKEKRICRMGQYYGKVYPNGDVYRCCAEELRPHGRLGNLLDDEKFSLLTEPKLCNIENCPCWKAMIVREEEKWASHWRL